MDEYQTEDFEVFFLHSRILTECQTGTPIPSTTVSFQQSGISVELRELLAALSALSSSFRRFAQIKTNGQQQQQQQFGQEGTIIGFIFSPSHQPGQGIPRHNQSAIA